ncbi:MAG: threonine aldolase [Actinomycetes bacterium]|jgi:threonine aldolase|nr:threonine aldolase [Actinomycetes bacterium]
MRAFGSDNYSGAHPAVFDKLRAVNADHVVAYGDDPYSAEAVSCLQRQLAAPDAHIRFTFNGTGTNVLCLSALLHPWESVLCADSAHIHTDEGGAAEYLAGLKLVAIPVADSLSAPDGKLTPQLIEPYRVPPAGEHSRQPRVISISNVTELGTVYTPTELKTLSEYAHSHGLYLHCDGARIANAAAALGVPLSALTSEVGLDALSFGGTKNALLGAEAAIWFSDAARAVEGSSFFLRKESAQLSSKMRFVAAQFLALYEGELWLQCANQANAMARRLAGGMRTLGIELPTSPDANEVFAQLPPGAIAPLQERFHFYTWDEAAHIIRWVCSWDTTPEEVDELIAAVREAVIA